MRFDFNDSYEQIKLEEIVQRITRKNKFNTSNLPLTISAQYGLIDQITFFNKSVASKDLSGYYLINNGEFAYNKSYSNDYPWGAIKRLDNYDKGCLSTLYICFKIIDNKKIFSDYLVHYFESPKWHKQISDIAGEGARNHGLLNIAVNDFFLTKHMFPKFQEQTKIADFLNKLERRIETQFKIINNLESQKKYLIKNIFSNLNASNKTLYDYANIYQSETISLNEMKASGRYYVYGANGIIGKYDKYNHENKQICLTCRGASCGALNFSEPKSWITGNAMIINTDSFSSIIDKEYLFYYLHSIDFKRYISGSGQPQITRESIIKMTIKVPSLSKQIKIKNLFISIQKRIEVEKQTLSLYDCQKSYLLNNLFI